MPTGAQIRAARALLRWSMQDLADKAQIGISTVQRMELSDGMPASSGKNIEAVQHVLEAAGVEFLPGAMPIPPGAPGVRMRGILERSTIPMSSTSTKMRGDPRVRLRPKPRGKTRSKH